MKGSNLEAYFKQIMHFNKNLPGGCRGYLKAAAFICIIFFFAAAAYAALFTSCYEQIVDRFVFAGSTNEPQFSLLNFKEYLLSKIHYTHAQHEFNDVFVMPVSFLSSLPLSSYIYTMCFFFAACLIGYLIICCFIEITCFNPFLFAAGFIPGQIVIIALNRLLSFFADPPDYILWILSFFSKTPEAVFYILPPAVLCLFLIKLQKKALFSQLKEFKNSFNLNKIHKILGNTALCIFLYMCCLGYSIYSGENSISGDSYFLYYDVISNLFKGGEYTALPYFWQTL